jgi:hypothetical protein
MANAAWIAGASSSGFADLDRLLSMRVMRSGKLTVLASVITNHSSTLEALSVSPTNAAANRVHACIAECRTGMG